LANKDGQSEEDEFDNDSNLGMSRKGRGMEAQSKSRRWPALMDNNHHRESHTDEKTGRAALSYAS